MKREAAFETHFGQCAALFKMAFIKIPDLIPTKERIRSYQNGMAPEALKPFDGILITPTATFCIEFKYGYGKQSPNQKFTEERINKIQSDAYYLVRKTDKGLFRIEQSEILLFETNKLEELCLYFRDGIRRQYVNCK